jgi:hypothetical protein
MRREKLKLEGTLGEEVLGNRQHYLRFQIPDSYSALEKTGLTYDSTLGYSDKVGYRAGISFPFRPYDVSKKRPCRFLEIPLAIMDGALMRESGSFSNGTPNWLIRMMDLVSSYGGLVSALWHQSVMDTRDFPGYMKMYLDFFGHFSGSGAWLAPGRDIIRWWSEREKASFELEASGKGNFRIVLEDRVPPGLYLVVIAASGEKISVEANPGKIKLRNGSSINIVRK